MSGNVHAAALRVQIRGEFYRSDARLRHGKVLFVVALVVDLQQLPLLSRAVRVQDIRVVENESAQCEESGCRANCCPLLYSLEAPTRQSSAPAPFHSQSADGKYISSQ